MKRAKPECNLHSCSFCNQCLPEWLPAIAAHRQTLQYKKGETLFKEGDTVTGIYFLNTGKVKVHSRWDGDKELIVRFAGAGDIVGHRGIGKQLVYPITATTLEPATACFIPLDFFEASLKVNAGYTYGLLMFYASELQESERRMRNLAHMPVKGRVAHALLSLHEKFGIAADGALNIELSRQELASYVGATYETVLRTLNEYAEAGVLSVSGKQVFIQQLIPLQQLAVNPAE